jgi:hemerythrin-like metal-binding protein
LAFVSWSDALSVGVKASDDDHKKLIGMLNRLHDGMRAGQGKEVVGKVIDELVSYTKFHFAREEEFFARTRYPADEHKKEHADLVAQVVNLQKKHKAGEISLSIETMLFLKDWLTNHIQGTDKQYSSHLNANGIR